MPEYLFRPYRIVCQLYLILAGRRPHHSNRSHAASHTHVRQDPFGARQDPFAAFGFGGMGGLGGFGFNDDFMSMGFPMGGMGK